MLNAISRYICLAAPCLLLIAFAQREANADLPTATEVKCLMMVDYDAFNFKPAAEAAICRDRMKKTAGMFERTVQLIGQNTHVPVGISALRNVTRDGILNALNTTTVSPTTTLIVYYHGHGATDGVRGHYFALTNGPPVFRSEVLDASLFPARPMLLILFSDCCSARIDVGGAAAPAAINLAQVLKNLFLQHRGVVDLTGATYYPELQAGQVGILDKDGAYFTKAYYETLLSIPFMNPDKDRDGFVSWSEFFPEVQQATDDEYAAALARGQGHPGQLHQRPQAFCLARRSDINNFTPRSRLGLELQQDGNGGMKVEKVAAGLPAANIIEFNGRRQNGNSYFVKDDIIRRMNGQRVRSMFEVYTVLEGIPEGESLRIEGIDAVHDNRPYSALVRLDR